MDEPMKLASEADKSLEKDASDFQPETTFSFFGAEVNAQLLMDG